DGPARDVAPRPRVTSARVHRDDDEEPDDPGKELPRSDGTTHRQPSSVATTSSMLPQILPPASMQPCTKRLRLWPSCPRVLRRSVSRPTIPFFAGSACIR